MAQMYDGALLHMSAMGSRGWEEMHRQARPPFLHPQDNGIMEIHEHNLEGVINLSTAMKKEEKAMKNSITNGNVENGGTSPSQSLHEKLSGHKRKSKCPSEPAVPQMMMMAPQQAITPQQMQHILQQQLSNPQHLQQMMQQHSMAMQQQAQHKVQEQMMQQLNEQLQINILQQSQLLQQSSGAGKKQDPKQTAVQLQQLQLQQQQLIQQIQMQQRQYFLAQGLMGLPQVPGGQGLMTPVEMQQLWKEVQAHQTAREGGPEEAKVSNSGVVMAASSPPMASLPHLPHLQSPHHTPQALVPNGLPEGGNFQIPGVLNPMVQQMTEKAIHNGSPNNHQIHNNQSKSPSTPTERASKDKTHSLYGHGVCKWPGCDTPCDDFHEFEKHIDEEHQLDDRSTAQARVQMQVVNQLELQLAKEKERLTAMMQHLHMKPNAPELCGTMKSETTPKVRPSPPQLSPEVVKLPPPPPAIPMVTSTPTLSLPTPGLAAMTLPVYTAPSTPQPLTPHCGLSTPHPLSGLPSQTPPSSGPMRRRVSDKCNLPISAEIQRNREFYKYSDVRPPFTYASLIRQGIIESPEKQLTLNEIYQWFMNTFAFFRKNQATWKNAVRHNLSLHKCFMRVENVKGAVWTVDEAEFYKRRPQKMGGNIQLKGSGDCLRAPNHYVHSLTSSMRAAMGEGAPQSASAEDSLDDECMAEDLSMSSHMSHGDLSGSADLSHAGYDEMHETEHGDASQDLVTCGSSPSMRDSVPDQPEDLRWEQHKSEPQNGNVHMIEPEDPGHHHGEPHMGYLPHEKEERREPPLPHHFNGLPVDASPPRETMVSDIGHGASMSEGTDPIKVISVQPQIHDELEDERDENEAPVHSNVLDN